ncbi:hypothetical protein [Streptomyces sp. NPDC002644]
MIIPLLAVATAVALGAAYLLKVPPFDTRGEITEAAVCAPFGPSQQVVKNLRAVLPDRASYDFADRTRSAQGSRTGRYSNYCSVRGDEEHLLSVGTELQIAEDPQVWAERSLPKQLNDEGSLTPFHAGAQGMASPTAAAVFVPCTSPEEGVAYNLTVTVELGASKSPGEAGTRERLIALAKAAALQAHRDAQCTLPSGVDR